MHSPTNEERRQAKEQSKSHEKKKGESLVLEGDSVEMEFEERKGGERRASQPSNQLSKHSKSRSGRRSKGRSKKTNV